MSTPRPGPALGAWVDESMIQRPDGVSVYVLGAALVRAEHADEVRTAVRDQRTGRQPKLHWRNESDARQTRIIALTAPLPIAGVAVVAAPLNLHRPERGRRCAMEVLLPHLISQGVNHVWLEARQKALNARDLRHVDAMRNARIIDSTLRVDIARPSGEPLLWLADTLAGAAAAAERGDGQHLVTLGSLVTRLGAVVR